MKRVVAVLLCFAVTRLFAVPAFPGAEGAGANATGGRGGTVYHVINTNNSGAGSLRDAVSQPNRTIVFDVSGTINLLTDLSISSSNLTIAGQTAPGDGITLMRRNTSLQNTHNVIIRYLRCRVGDVDPSFQDDSFHCIRVTNCIIDHVSSSWSVDECFSVTWSSNVTVQWCMIAESLRTSQHDKGAHGYGTLLRYGKGLLSFHHNLYQQHDSRNPRLGDNHKLDFVNNLIYNWGGRAGYSGGDSTDLGDNPGGYVNHLNYVKNYLVAGPATSSSSGTLNSAFLGGATNTIIYQTNNIIDSNKNAVLDGGNTGWSMFTGTYVQTANRYPIPGITEDTAQVASQRVIAFAGASQVRDEVDHRLIGNVRSHSSRLVDAVGPNTQPTDYATNMVGTNFLNFVRGWPVLNSLPAPTDTDADGMPNYWEQNLGMNPAVANNNTMNGDGYTDLEHYLNWLGDLHKFGTVNQIVPANLRVLTGNGTNLIFTVAAGTNGAVSLAGDGYTAQFQPDTNFIGLGTFTFNASNFVDHIAFGPITVTLFVTNVPPLFIAQPASRTNISGDTATFSVTGISGALRYQWSKGITPISGATNSTLALVNASTNDAASYSVVVTNFTGAVTSSVASLTILPNTAPALAAIADATLMAGATLTFTNAASDPDQPPQVLSFSLLNAPGDATVGASSGIFAWRPSIAQGGSTNLLSVVVSDNGLPVLTATQSFSVFVLQPAPPQALLSVAGNQATLTVTGDAGPDYILQTSTNLVDWNTILTTNPVSLPFQWPDAGAGDFSQRFYRVRLGP